jgi:hypothetical protein
MLPEKIDRRQKKYIETLKTIGGMEAIKRDTPSRSNVFGYGEADVGVVRDEEVVDIDERAPGKVEPYQKSGGQYAEKHKVGFSSSFHILDDWWGKIPTRVPG